MARITTTFDNQRSHVMTVSLVAGSRAIDVDESVAKVENFVKQHNFSFRIFLDSDSDVAESFGILGIPTYFLIDKKGIIRYEGNSFPEEEYKRLISG